MTEPIEGNKSKYEMAKDIQKKVRNTIFLYFLKHILYIHLPEQPHLYGSDFQNYSTLILYFAPDVHS